MKGAGTIQGWKLFKGEKILRKFGTHNIVCENARILLQKIFYPIVWGDLVNLTPSHFYSMELRTTIREVCCVVRSNSSYLNGFPTF